MTINSALQDWIMEVTSYDDQHVIIENQDGPRPIGDFATYDVISVVPADYSYWSKTDLGGGDIQFDYMSQNVLTVSVNIYASDGLSLLQDLFQSRYLKTIRDFFKDEKMSLIRTGDPLKIPEPGETGWFNRYQVDFDFLSYHTISEIIEQITLYQFTGKFIRDEDVIDTVSFEVPE